jgi:sporulation protein YtfJ
MSLDVLAKTVMEQLQNTIDTKTIVGEPIVCGDTTVIPVTKVSFGFGVGGRQVTNSKKDDSFGGGTGGGASLEPMGFVVVNSDGAQLIPFRSNMTVWERVVTPANLQMVVSKVKELKAALSGSKEETN